MKIFKISLLALFFGAGISSFGQNENDDYLEFNDRNNVVHGVYLGLRYDRGKINEDPSYTISGKLAYVANQQFEVGIAATYLLSQQSTFIDGLFRPESLLGAYGGLHLEPIFFSKKRVNLSFPLLLGGGAVGYINNRFFLEDDEERFREDGPFAIFVVEPGVNVLLNISRYLQIEAGVKYRFSSGVDLSFTRKIRINGFSAGLGIKVGIFNMGRNRYKKNVK